MRTHADAARAAAARSVAARSSGSFQPGSPSQDIKHRSAARNQSALHQRRSVSHNATTRSILDKLIESVRIGRVMNGSRIKRTRPWLALSASLVAAVVACTSAATLDDLKQLEITCYVPSHLPQGFQLKKVEITYEEPSGEGGQTNRPLPHYSLEYSNGWSGTFSVESAREGIGDRNIMEEEDTEETEIQSPFGPMYLIYRPKGKNGRKDEIKANWVSDANMNAETAKGPGFASHSRPVSRIFRNRNYTRR